MVDGPVHVEALSPGGNLRNSTWSADPVEVTVRARRHSPPSRIALNASLGLERGLQEDEKVKRHEKAQFRAKKCEQLSRLLKRKKTRINLEVVSGIRPAEHAFDDLPLLNFVRKKHPPPPAHAARDHIASAHIKAKLQASFDEALHKEEMTIQRRKDRLARLRQTRLENGLRDRAGGLYSSPSLDNTLRDVFDIKEEVDEQGLIHATSHKDWQARLRELAKSTDIPLSHRAQIPPASDRLVSLAKPARNRRVPLGFLRPDHADLRGLYVRPKSRADGVPAAVVRGSVHSARAPSYWFAPPPPSHRIERVTSWDEKERSRWNSSLDAFEQKAHAVHNFRPHLTTPF